MQPPRYCGTCKKIGHLPEACWITYPHLKKTKKAQGVDEEEGEKDCSFIDLGVLEVQAKDDGATTEMFYQSDEDLYEEKARMQAAAAAAEETETAGVSFKPLGDISVGTVGVLQECLCPSGWGITVRKHGPVCVCLHHPISSLR